MLVKSFLFIVFMLLPALGFAQTVKMTNIKGQVLIKQPGGKWTKAAANMEVSPQTEIKTKGASSCALVFDKEGKNVVTVQRKTSAKIENVSPGEVFLSKGRVFALIKNKSAEGEFKVRTPTAVAGARGTGWETVYEGGKTEVKVFDDIVFVGGIDKEGREVEPVDVKEGLEVDVAKDGEKSELTEIPVQELEQWQEFQAEAEKIQEETQQVIEQEQAQAEGGQPEAQGEPSSENAVVQEPSSQDGGAEEPQPQGLEGEPEIQLEEEPEIQLEEEPEIQLEDEPFKPEDIQDDIQDEIKETIKENVKDTVEDLVEQEIGTEAVVEKGTDITPTDEVIE